MTSCMVLEWPGRWRVGGIAARTALAVAAYPSSLVVCSLFRRPVFHRWSHLRTRAREQCNRGPLGRAGIVRLWVADRRTERALRLPRPPAPPTSSVTTTPGALVYLAPWLALALGASRSILTPVHLRLFRLRADVPPGSGHAGAVHHRCIHCSALWVPSRSSPPGRGRKNSFSPGLPICCRSGCPGGHPGGHSDLVGSGSRGRRRSLGGFVGNPDQF